MCPTGMCVTVLDSCLNEIGCPESRPKRCEYSGECIASTASCDGQFDLMENMDITLANSFCAALDMVTCFSANSWQSLMYCAESLDTCFHSTNDCPIDEPVLCCGSCVTRLEDCANVCDIESYTSFLSLTPVI
jgi:hypothetical protein